MMRKNIISILLIIFCVGKTRAEQIENNANFFVGSTKTDLTAEQIKEVAKMRQEIADKIDAQLPVTDEQRRTTQEISELLSSAVGKNSYINPKYSDGSAGINKYISSHTSLFSPLLGSAPISTSPDTNINVNIIESMVLSEIIENLKTKTSDFREKFVKDNEIWHPSLPNKDNMYREILQIQSVSQVLTFKLAENVKLWKTMPKGGGGKTGLIGMMDEQIILVTELNNVFKVEARVTFPSPPKIIDVFLDWKSAEQRTTGYVAVVHQTELIFLALDKKYENITEHYRINLQKPIVYIKYFQIDGADVLLLITKNSVDDEKYSTDIYEIDMNRKELWLMQVINLPEPCNHIATLDTGRDYILSFPQKDMVLIYNYRNDGNEKGKFVRHSSVPAESVTYISGFSMGRYSYLAIGGSKPQILRYHRGQIYPQTILSGSFGVVEQWFPIAARTHRDDMVLLVQHRINYTTHSLSVLEALIWDGQAFNTVPHTPCYRGSLVSHFGMTCMLDFEREFGLFGATIIQRSGNISMLVPRDNEPSALFNLNMKLMPVSDPLQEDVDELELTYGILSELLGEHDKMVEEMAYLINNGLNPESDNIVTGDWVIDSMEAPEMYLSDAIIWQNNQITVGDQPLLKEDLNIHVSVLEGFLQKNIEKIDKLMKPTPARVMSPVSNSYQHRVDPVRANGQFSLDSLQTRGRFKRESEILRISDLDVTNIVFETVNDIPASDLIFRNENNLDLSGTPTFEGEVMVGDLVFLESGGLVNGVPLKDTFIHVGGPTVGNMSVDAIEVVQNLNVVGEKVAELVDSRDNSKIIANELIVDGNCDFRTINGVDFEQFLSTIVAKNLPRKIDQMSVQGKVTVQNHLNLNILNGLSFPADYLWSTGPSESIITGVKIFKNNLTTTAIDTDGTIDGISPQNIITLDQDEFIDGETTFRHLEVGTSLDLNGSLEGRHLSEFLKNPSLLQTNQVKSACVFKSLIVEGDIIIEDTFNGLSLDPILEDVIYQDQPDPIQVNSFKNFHEIIVDDLHLSSGLINGIDMAQFITLDTDQTLNIRSIVGDVFFGNLQISGLFDFLNVTDVDENTIKITGDQFTEAELICHGNGDDSVIDIEASLLEIQGSINDRPINGLHLNTNGVVIEQDIVVDDLMVELLSAEQGVVGVETINGVDLNQFDQTRFSLTRPQIIEAPTKIKFCQTFGDLEADKINELEMKTFINSMKNFESIPTKLLNGELEFDQITVEGNVLIKSINGFDVEKLKEKVVWMNRPNILKGTWTFLDELQVRANLKIDGFLNGNVVENWLGDIVLRNETVVIRGSKYFANGFTVDKDVIVGYLNGIDINQILLRNQKNYVQSVTIYGNVQVYDINTTSINYVDLTAITSRYSYDEATRCHVIRENVIFHVPVTFAHLIADGPLNDIFNVNQLLGGIVQRNGTMQIAGRKVFINNLSFPANIHVENLNGYNLQRELDDIVYIDHAGTIDIEGNLIFNGPMIFPILKVAGNLIGDNIAGSNPRDWILNGLMINENIEVKVPLIFTANTFRPAGLRVTNINTKPLSKLIPLHSQQDLSNTTLIVGEILTENQIDVGRNVNNMSLKFERDNTLVTFGDQQVVSPLRIGNISIVELTLPTNEINGKPLKDIVTIQRPSTTLIGSFTFDKIESPALVTTNLVSGINVQHWFDKSLWRTGRASQTVTANWTFTNAHVTNSISGSGKINNYTIHEIIEAREMKRAQILTELKEYAKYNFDICHDLQKLVYLSYQGVYFFKYFESGFSLVTQGEKSISSSLFFKHGGHDLLLVNAQCLSTIYRWTPESGRYKRIGDFETGSSREWISLHVTADVHFVSSGDHDGDLKCPLGGSNIWKFDGSKLSLVEKLPNNIKINTIQVSPNDPNRFVVVHENDTKITEFDVRASRSEEWVVPANGRLRLLPKDILLGLAVADGRQISILMTNNNSRTRRAACESCEDDNKLLAIGVKSSSLKAFGFEKPTVVGQAIIPPNNNVGKTHLEKQLKIGQKKWKKFVADLKSKTKKNFRESDNVQTTLEDPNNPQVGTFDKETSEDKFFKDIVVRILEKSFEIGEKIVKDKKPVHGEVEDYDRSAPKRTSQDPQLGSSLPTLTGTLFPNTKLNQSLQDLSEKMNEFKKKMDIGRKFERKEETSVATPTIETTTETTIDITSISIETSVASTTTETTTDITSTSIASDEVVDISEIFPKIKDPMKKLVDNKINISANRDDLKKKIGIGKKHPEKTVEYQQAVDELIGEEAEVISQVRTGNEMSSTLPTTVNYQIVTTTTETPPKDHVGRVSEIFPLLEDPMKKLVDKAIKFSADIDDFKKMGIGKKFTKTHDKYVPDDDYLEKPKTEDSSPQTKYSGVSRKISANLNGEEAEGVSQVRTGNEMSSTLTTTETYQIVTTTSESTPTDEIFPILEDPMRKSVDTSTKLSANIDDKKIGIGKKFTETHDKYFPDDDYLETEDTSTQPKYSVGSDIFSPMKKSEFGRKVVKNNNEIAMPISPGNVSVTENLFIPERGHGEMIVMQINFRGFRRTFVAVSTTRESRIPGHENLIYIYEDVLEGKLFQTLSVYRPSGLTTIHLRDQTIFSYLEDNKAVQVYTYQGIEGFIHTNQIILPSHGNGLTAISLPGHYMYGCQRHYLVVKMSGRLWFLEAIMEGDCGIDINLDCDNYPVY